MVGGWMHMTVSVVQCNFQVMHLGLIAYLPESPVQGASKFVLGHYDHAVITACLLKEAVMELMGIFKQLKWVTMTVHLM